MCGSAMFTMVPSSTIMSCAPLMTASAIPRPRRAAPGLGFGEDVRGGDVGDHGHGEAFRGQGRVDRLRRRQGYAAGVCGGVRVSPGASAQGGPTRGQDDVVHDRGDVGDVAVAAEDDRLVHGHRRQDRGQPLEVGVGADLAALLGAAEGADRLLAASARGSGTRTPGTAPRRGAAPA